MRGRAARLWVPTPERRSPIRRESKQIPSGVGSETGAAISRFTESLRAFDAVHSDHEQTRPRSQIIAVWPKEAEPLLPGGGKFLPIDMFLESRAAKNLFENDALPPREKQVVLVGS